MAGPPRVAAVKPDAGEALAQAVCERFPGFDGRVEVESLVSRPWSSIAFRGERHRLGLRVQGKAAAAAADRFLAELDVGAFLLDGHFLADIAFAEDARRDNGRSVSLALEALTVETR